MKKLQIKLNKKSTLIWALILGGITLLFMAVFPSMANESMQQLVDGKLDALPEALLAIVGFETIPDFTDIRVFYAYIMQYINIALGIFAFSLGLSSFLKEEETGTVEFLYAQAISRYDFVVQKLIANAMLVVSVVSVIVVSSVLSFVMFKPVDLELMPLLFESLPLFASYYVLVLIFLVFGTGLSLVLKSGISINALSMGLVFITYVAGLMSSMVSFLEPLKHVSILHALFPSAIYSGDVNFITVILWFVVAIASLGLGMLYFKKRDILV